MKVGERCPQPRGWNTPEGLTRKWTKVNSHGSPHTPEENPARHTSNSGVTRFHKEPDMGTRCWYSRGRALHQT